MNKRERRYIKKKRLIKYFFKEQPPFKKSFFSFDGNSVIETSNGITVKITIK